MKSLPYDVYEEVYNETGLDLGNRFEKMGVIANSMEKNIRNMVDFVRLIPGFLELSTKDQLSLIKCKYIAIWRDRAMGVISPVSALIQLVVTWRAEK